MALSLKYIFVYFWERVGVSRCALTALAHYVDHFAIFRPGALGKEEIQQRRGKNKLSIAHIFEASISLKLLLEQWHVYMPLQCTFPLVAASL